MSTLKDTHIPSETYNSLPYILDVANVPSYNRQDIDDILSLFRKHNVPQGVRVKLVHKHFDAGDNEIMVFRDITVPYYEIVSVMGPMSPKQSSRLRGLNYFVDGDGQLQSYEYSSSVGPDTSNLDTFFREFCELVVERSLQMKLGLRIGLDTDWINWTEFEIPEKRGTVMITSDVSLPKYELKTTVVTEWEAHRIANAWCAGHCTSHCNGHCYGHEDYKLNPQGSRAETDDWYLAGVKLEAGSTLQTIVKSVVNGL